MTEKQKILVVEDNLLCREILKEILEMAGYHVETHQNSHSACAMLRSKTINCDSTPACADYVLTDHHLPGTNGFDMLKMLNENECGIRPERQAIISGSWAAGELLKAQQLGCKVFSKPYDFDAILTWLKKVPTE